MDISTVIVSMHSAYLDGSICQKSPMVNSSTLRIVNLNMLLITRITMRCVLARRR